MHLIFANLLLLINESGSLSRIISGKCSYIHKNNKTIFPRISHPIWHLLMQIAEKSVRLFPTKEKLVTRHEKHYPHNPKSSILTVNLLSHNNVFNYLIGSITVQSYPFHSLFSQSNARYFFGPPHWQ